MGLFDDLLDAPAPTPAPAPAPAPGPAPLGLFDDLVEQPRFQRTQGGGAFDTYSGATVPADDPAVGPALHPFLRPPTPGRTPVPFSQANLTEANDGGVSGALESLGGGFVGDQDPGDHSALRHAGAGGGAAIAGFLRGAAALMPPDAQQAHAMGLAETAEGRAHAAEEGSTIGRASELAGGLAPWFLGAPGMAFGATTQAGNTRQSAKESGAGEGKADTLAAVDALASIMLPRAAEAGLAPLTSRLGQAVAARAGGIVGGAAEHAVGGAGAGAALTLGQAGVQAGYDPQAAAATLRSLPEQALLGGGLGSLAGAFHGAAAGPDAQPEPVNASGLTPAQIADFEHVLASVPDQHPADQAITPPTQAAGGPVPSPEDVAALRAAALPTPPDPSVVAQARPGAADVDSGEPVTAQLPPLSQTEPITLDPVEMGLHPDLAKALHDRVVAQAAGAGQSPETLRAATADLASRTPVDRRGAVPYGGGTDTAGGRVYLDPAMPKALDVSGQTVDPTPFLVLHERVEKPLLDSGMPYEQAHQIATSAERAAVEAHGLDWNAYSAALQPHLDAARNRAARGGVPADLEPKPYRDSRESHLIEGADRGQSQPPQLPPGREREGRGPAADGAARQATIEDLFRARQKEESLRGQAADAEARQAAGELPRGVLSRAPAQPAEAAAAGRAAAGAATPRMDALGDRAQPGGAERSAAGGAEARTDLARGGFAERRLLTKDQAEAPTRQMRPVQPTRAAGPAAQDLLDEIRSLGGIQARPRGETGGEYDGRPDMAPAYRRTISGSLAPDQMAAALADRGIGDGTPDTMWRLLGAAVRSRKASGQGLESAPHRGPERQPGADEEDDLGTATSVDLQAQGGEDPFSTQAIARQVPVAANARGDRMAGDGRSRDLLAEPHAGGPDGGEEPADRGMGPAGAGSPEAGRADRGAPGSVHAPQRRYDESQQSFLSPEGRVEQALARGDTRPSDDARLRAVLDGTGAKLEPGDRLGRLIGDFTDDRRPSIPLMRGAKVADVKDAAVLFAVIRSPHAERLAWMLVGPDGTVKHNGLWSIGTVDAAMVPDPSELATLAQRVGAERGDRMVWAHNHPSGDPTPSPADHAVYARMRGELAKLGVDFDGLVLNGTTFSHNVGTGQQHLSGQYQGGPGFQNGERGAKINDPGTMASYMKGIQTEPGTFLAVHVDARLHVQGVEAFDHQPTPAELLESRAAAAASYSFVVGEDTKVLQYDRRTVDLFRMDGDRPASLRIDGRFRPERAFDADRDTIANIVHEPGAQPKRDPAERGEFDPIDDPNRPPEEPAPKPAAPPAPRDRAVGLAPGDRVNARPDLAIHQEDPRLRDLAKIEDAKREQPEPISRASDRERAAEDLRRGGILQREAILDKIRQPRATLSNDEQQQAFQMEREAYERGDIAQATEIHHRMRDVRGELARALGVHDPAQSPAERAKDALRQVVLRPRLPANAPVEQVKARIQRDVARINAEAERLGIDPITLENRPKPKRTLAQAAGGISDAAKARRVKLNVEAKGLYDQLKKSLKAIGRGESVGSSGGEALDLLTKLAANRAQAGLLRFAEFAADLAKHVPEAMQHAAAAWEAARKEHPALGMDEADDPQRAIALDRARKLADKWAAEDERVRGLSPDERLDELLAAKAKRAIPQEIKDAVAPIRQQAAEARAAIRQRDAAILFNADRMLRVAQRVKGDAWDAYYEWARAAIHTSPKLIAKKIATDAVNGFLRFGPEGILARLVNALPGGKDMRDAGSLGAAYRALIPGLADGWRNALRTWKMETSALHEDVNQARAAAAIEGRGEFHPESINEYHGASLLPPYLQWVKKMPGGIRWVQAFNDLAETTFARMAAAENAVHSAKAAGLEPGSTAWTDHVHSESTDLASPSWEKALQDAYSQTGTKRAEGRFHPVNILNKLANLDPSTGKTTAERVAKRAVKEATRWTFLFRTLPFNIAAKGLAMSPPGVAATIAGRTAYAAANVARGKVWTYGRERANTDIARGLISTAVLALVAQANAARPVITGNQAQFDPRDQFAQKTPPHSVYLFGAWRDYMGIGSASHILSTAADMLTATHDVLHGRGIATAGKDFARKLWGQFRDETILRNGGDVLDAARGDGTAAERMAATWATLAYPTFLRQAQSQASGTVEDRRIHPDGALGRIADYAARGTGWSARYEFPAVDLFGHELQKPAETGKPAADYLFRLANPFAGPSDKTGDDDLKARLFAYNADHPDAPITPVEPKPSIKLHGVQRDMTREEFHDYLAARGAAAARILRASLGHGVSDDHLPKVTARAFTAASRIARYKVFGAGSTSAEGGDEAQALAP